MIFKLMFIAKIKKKIISIQPNLFLFILLFACYA